jgi:hypothetical protein
MATKCNNNIFSNIFSFFDASHLYVNLLNNFNIIYYKGLILPRINLNLTNSKKIETFIYSPIKNIDYNLLYENNEKNYIFEKKENIIKNIDSEEKIQINYNKDECFKFIVKNEKEAFNGKDNTFLINENQNDFSYKNIEKKEIIPPQKLISIINNDENKFDLCNNNYENINKIILANIDLLYNYNNIIFNKKKCIPKVINQVNNQTYFNFKICNNNIFSNNENLLKILSNKNKGKPIFKLCSKPEKEIDEKIKINKKRGRKATKIKTYYRIHKASDEDNLLRKIQVHFLSFVINYVNDILKSLIHNKHIPVFKNLDYQIKKNVNHKFVEELKSKNISDILQFRVSPKMKRYDENENKKIYSKICTKFPFMTNYFDKNYLSLFKEYYYNKNKLFLVNGKIIQLSKKTKIFNDLIKKDYRHKDNLQNLAIRIYLNS